MTLHFVQVSYVTKQKTGTTLNGMLLLFSLQRKTNPHIKKHIIVVMLTLCPFMWLVWVWVQ